jgi:hypothetical protein
MQPLPFSPDAKRLVSNLQAAEKHKAAGGQVFHVASLGAGFYFAYEQLRNAAEYRERHLLLRSAIERFLSREVSLRHFEPMAGELVNDLTQAGYLKNDTVALTTIDATDKLLERCTQLYRDLDKFKIASHVSAKWLIQYASVQIENYLTPVPKTAVVMQFAYEHYLASVDAKSIEKTTADDPDYRIALYCAVQRALFKSNLATVRYYCLSASLGSLDKQSPGHFIQLNELIDHLYQAPATNRLFRLINRYGAPMRIINEIIMDTNAPAELLASNRESVLARVKTMCAQQYEATHKQLNARIGKTILFILITKTLIGVSIEVPYDLAISKEIAWTPLLTNIFFPLLYMGTISAGIHTPSQQNTNEIAGFADRILYQGAGAPVVYKPKRRVKSRSLNGIFTFVYAVGFIGSISLLLWILTTLNYNIVNGGIFFLFFCAVSFLGFRLRQSAHELQMIDEKQGLLQTFADFLSAPFVRVGHAISDTYSKANIVTFVLDLAIEMPLKTSLRFVRQWIGFMRDKQEEL